MKSKAHYTVLSNSALGGVDFILNFAISLITVPIFLENWGSSKYALWITLQASFAIFQFFDLGLRTYAGYEINLTYHKDPSMSKKLVPSILLFVYFLAALPVLFTVFLFFNSSISSSFFGASIAEIDNSGLIVGLLLLQLSHFLIGAPTGLINATFFPKNMLVVSQKLSLVNTTFRLAILITIAFYNFDIITSCLIFALFQVGLGIASLAFIKKKVPEFYPWWKDFDLKVGFAAFRKSIFLTVNIIMQQLSNNGLILFTASFLGSIWVPAFTTLKTLTGLGTKMGNILAQSTLLQLIKAFSEKQSENVSSIIKVNWIVVGFLFNIGMVIIDPLVGDFFLLWTRGKLEFNHELYSLLIISTSLYNFGFIINQFVVGVNDLKGQNIITVVKIATLFVVLVILIRQFDLIAIGCSLVASELAGVIVSIFFVERYLITRIISTKQYMLFAVPTFLLALYFFISNFYGVKWYVSFITIILMVYIYYLAWHMLSFKIKRMFRDLLLASIRLIKK